MNSKLQQFQIMQSGMKPEIEVVKLIEDAIFNADALLKAKVKYEDIIVLLGTTKSGKSTLINFLIGNVLTAVKQKFGKTFLVKMDNETLGPEIGIASSSWTTLPTKWVVKNKSCINGLILWDAPGFGDSRGEIQDITNSFYIKTLLRGVKSAKIVLVTDFSDLYNDNVSSFVSLLESVKRIFNNDISSTFQSLVLIFNKTPFYCDSEFVDECFLCELLTEKIIKSASVIDKNCRSIVRSLVKCPERIGIFRKAAVELCIEELNDGIENAIKSATPLFGEFLCNVSPSVSEKSQTFLLRQKFLLASMPDIDILLNDFEKKYKSISQFFEKEVECADKETLEGIKSEIQRKLAELQRIVENNGETLVQMLVKLQVLDKEGAGKAITVHNLMNKAIVIQHIDDILKLKESEEFRLKIEKIAGVVIKNLESVLIKISEKQRQINDQETALRIALMEANFNRIFFEYEEIIDELTFSTPQVNRPCVVQFVTDVRYANPLLNDANFMQAFVIKYGGTSTSRLVELTNAIISIGGDDEVQALMSSAKRFEICFDLIRHGDD